MTQAILFSIISFVYVITLECNAQEVFTGAEQPFGRQAWLLSYPTFPGDARNVDYKSMTINGEPVDLAHFKNAGYGHFAFDGSPINVTITTYEPIQSFNISPRSYGIEARASGHQLSFMLGQPHKFIVQVNDLSPLFVFAEKLENDMPVINDTDVLNVLDFDIDKSGNVANTGNIQRAIDATAGLNNGKGGTLVFPDGKYLTGTLKMRDNVTLYLHGGAIVQGTTNLDDYSDPLGIARHLIVFHSVTNAAIRGRGAFDAAGTKMRMLYRERHRVLMILDSQNILVEGVSLRDSGTWNTHIIRSDDVTLRNVKVLCDVNLGNTDGIDPDSGSRLLIEDSFIYAADDGIVLKQTGRGGEPRTVEDAVIRDNVIWTKKSALKIGTETRGDYFRNITFENNDIVHADRGMVIYLYDGAVCEDIRFVNNRFEYIGGDRNQKLIHMEIRDRGGAGHIRNVLIKDVYADDFSPNDSVIQGLNENHRVIGLVFNNIVIGGKVRSNAEEARIIFNEFVDYEFRQGS